MKYDLLGTGYIPRYKNKNANSPDFKGEVIVKTNAGTFPIGISIWKQNGGVSCNISRIKYDERDNYRSQKFNRKVIRN